MKIILTFSESISDCGEGRGGQHFPANFSASFLTSGDDHIFSAFPLYGLPEPVKKQIEETGISTLSGLIRKPHSVDTGWGSLSLPVSCGAVFMTGLQRLQPLSAQEHPAIDTLQRKIHIEIGHLEGEMTRAPRGDGNTAN